VIVEPLRFAHRREGEETLVAHGRFEPGAPDWVYLPVELPDGVVELAVRCSHDRSGGGAAENTLDLGIFDQRGIEPGDGAGFRGWSGSSRDRFTISGSDATPGYLPGALHRGTWHVVLGPYTVAPEGMSWTVAVTLRYGRPGPAVAADPAPRRARGRGPGWYRGDMHLHTVHSDGRQTPAELVAGARAAELDFVVSTEHNTSSASRIWGRHARPDLLVVDGEEITTRDGHLLALGLPAEHWVDWRYRAADGVLGRVVDGIHRAGGIAVAAHPFCPFAGCGWGFGYREVDAIEVWNGPWTPDDERTLELWDGMLADEQRQPGGRWIPAVGNSDAHGEPQAIGLPHNLVLASDLERRAILRGVRAGRLWVAESAAVDLSMTARADGRTAGIGQRLRVAADAPVTLRLEVRGAPGQLARLHTDHGRVLERRLAEEGPDVVTWATTPRDAAYVRAEVRRPAPAPATFEAMVALTNPVFLGHPRPGRARLSGRPPA
jgi:hypothetical protein